MHSFISVDVLRLFRRDHTRRLPLTSQMIRFSAEGKSHRATVHDKIIASSYATRIESGPPAVLSEFPFTLCAFIFSEVDQSRYYKRHTENPGLKSMENQQK